MQSVKCPLIKVCLINLGCKVNKYELDCLATILVNKNYDVTFNLEFADIYVLSTCAVTNEAEKKSRQYISKLKKINPNAKIIVCGCASQNNLNQFKELDVYSIIGTEGKEKILDLIENQIQQIMPFDTKYACLKNPYKAQTRAYLKIQDGCNNFCSYCLIPYLRGRSRSRDLNDVISEAIELSKTSNEIVLTGIDLSSFKVDNKKYLGQLVYMLKDLPSRIRLGSLEVNVITNEFMKYLIKTPNFAPHFHLSLQSGSNSELKRMNRHYTVNDYLQKIELIRKYYPNANITTDIIVGFPEQTEEEFLETLQTVKQAKFGHIHIFPYSKRNGTNAEKLVQIDGNIKKDRVKRLTKLAKETENDYLNSMINKTFTMLTEDVVDDMFEGYTENYIKVYVKKDNLKENELIRVKLIKKYKQGLYCEIIK